MAHKPGHKGKAQWQKVNKGTRGVDLKFKGLSCPTWATNCGRKIKVGFDKLKRKVDFNVDIDFPKFSVSDPNISVERRQRDSNVGIKGDDQGKPQDNLNMQTPSNYTGRRDYEEHDDTGEVGLAQITGRKNNDAALAQFFKYKT